ncbi:MAG: cation transporter [Proteobacteria bacterium]|nr:cation transporter [Pseudomonadota bacterium]
MPSDHAPPGTTPLAQSSAITRRVTLYSVLTAVVLIGLKLSAWVGSGSVAMLSSLADSCLDLLAALSTFYAVRFAASPPDAEHRFGHGKAEGFASLFQGGLVFATGALIGREAIVRLLHPAPVTQGGWAVAVMAISILLTGLLVFMQTRALKAAGSVAVSADRAHYIADLASNVAALIGVAAAYYLGFHFADGLAGLVVAVWLIWGAVNVFRQASSQLMDEGLAPEARARIVALATADPRLTGVHQLRTRVSGPFVLMQMHADLDPNLTLEQAHEILVEAENRILSEFPAADILIHPDPRGRAEPHGGAFAETAAAHAPGADAES